MKNKFYRCNICNRIVEVVEDGQGPLICCGQEMEILEPNTVDASFEKHVPTIEKIKNGVRIKVGSEEHPMLPEHYIMWIEVVSSDVVERKYLQPGEKPEVEFAIDGEAEAIIYCNLHGLWSSKIIQK